MATPIRNIRVTDADWAHWKTQAEQAGYSSRAAYIHALILEAGKADAPRPTPPEPSPQVEPRFK